MAQPEDVAALLEGPKDRRVECAITSTMDAVVGHHARTRGVTRSQSVRQIMALGIASNPDLVQVARELRRRDRE